MRKEKALEIKKCVVDNIHTKNIYLFGFSQSALDFHFQNKEEYNIVAFVSEGNYRIEEEIEFVRETGLSVINWQVAVEDENAYFIIFKLNVRYEAMLSSEGLLWPQNYCDIECLNLFLTTKEIMLIAGHCQTDLLYNFLVQIPEFCDKYTTVFFASNKKHSRWASKLFNFARSICDYYVYVYSAPGARSQDHKILNFNSKERFFSKDELPGDCKIYRIPNLTAIHMYWPTMTPETLNPYYEYFRGAQHWLNRRHAPLCFTDEYLKEKIDAGETVDNIVYSVYDSNMIDKSVIETHTKTMLEIVSHVDDGCDMAIGDFISDNYRKQMLFKDADHMQTALAKEYLIRFLKMFESYSHETEKLIDILFLEDVCAYKELEFHCTEIPVYPCVAKQMGLEWWSNSYKYKILLYNGTVELTLDEYVRKYCEISKAMNELQNIW